MLHALRRPANHSPRDTHLLDVLSQAADVAFAIAAAQQVQQLAARLTEAGNPDLAGGALTAGQPAAAARRSAAALAAINLERAGIHDDRLAGARALQSAPETAWFCRLRTRPAPQPRLFRFVEVLTATSDFLRALRLVHGVLRAPATPLLVFVVQCGMWADVGVATSVVPIDPDADATGSSPVTSTS